MVPWHPCFLASATLVAAGGIAGIVSVLGLIVLGVLYGRRAREVRRLRAWAGALPEQVARRREQARKRAFEVEHGTLAGKLRGVDAPAARWRIARRPVTAIVLGVLVAAAVAALPGGTGHRPRPTAGKRAEPPAATDVAVLNGTGIPGVAALAADRLKRRGYRVGLVSNAPHRARATQVDFATDNRASAKRVARALHVPVSSVVPLDRADAATVGQETEVVVTVGRRS